MLKFVQNAILELGLVAISESHCSEMMGQITSSGEKKTIVIQPARRYLYFFGCFKSP